MLALLLALERARESVSGHGSTDCGRVIRGGISEHGLFGPAVRISNVSSESPGQPQHSIIPAGEDRVEVILMAEGPGRAQRQQGGKNLPTMWHMTGGLEQRAAASPTPGRRTYPSKPGSGKPARYLCKSRGLPLPIGQTDCPASVIGQTLQKHSSQVREWRPALPDRLVQSRPFLPPAFCLSSTNCRSVLPAILWGRVVPASIESSGMPTLHVLATAPITVAPACCHANRWLAVPEVLDPLPQVW